MAEGCTIGAGSDVSGAAGVSLDSAAAILPLFAVFRLLQARSVSTVLRAR